MGLIKLQEIFFFNLRYENIFFKCTLSALFKEVFSFFSIGSNAITYHWNNLSLHKLSSNQEIRYHEMFFDFFIKRKNYYIKIYAPIDRSHRLITKNVFLTNIRPNFVEKNEKTSLNNALNVNLKK